VISNCSANSTITIIEGVDHFEPEDIRLLNSLPDDLRLSGYHPYLTHAYEFEAHGWGSDLVFPPHPMI
jgi:hypothetical protein